METVQGAPRSRRAPAGHAWPFTARRRRAERPIYGSTDPELVDEQAKEGVELVVADPCRQHDQGTRVVERDPGGLAGDLPVDVRPAQPCGVGRTGLGGEGLPDLGVYPWTAELAVVHVGGIAREEGLAAEQRPEEVPCRGIIRLPDELTGLNAVA